MTNETKSTLSSALDRQIKKYDDRAQECCRTFYLAKRDGNNPQIAAIELEYRDACNTYCIVDKFSKEVMYAANRISGDDTFLKEDQARQDALLLAVETMSRDSNLVGSQKKLIDSLWCESIKMKIKLEKLNGIYDAKTAKLHVTNDATLK